MKFNWEQIKKILLPKEKLVSIEISESNIRVFAFRPNSYVPKIMEVIVLPAGVFDKGNLVRPEILVQAFNSLKQKLQKFRQLPCYIILSLPEQNFYTNVVPLPELSGQDLIEAVKLNAQMNSPIALDDAYYDWQKISLASSTDQATYVFIAVANKHQINPYISMIEDIGLKVAAIEPRSLSLARTIYNLSGIKEPYLVININRDGIDAFLAQNENVVFSDFDSWSEILPNTPLANISLEQIKEHLSTKIPQLLNFYSSRYNYPIKHFYFGSIIPQARNVLPGFMQQDFQLQPITLRLPAKWNIITDEWLPIIGSAIRGSIPRANDVIVSLTPVGTEQGYVQARTLSYLSFWIKIAATFLFCV